MDEKNISQPEAKEETFTKEQVEQLIAKERKESEVKIREAEKLAKMDSQQKASYELEQMKTALSEREAAVSKRELMAEAAEKLGKYKLPKSLVSCVNLSSAEECEKSIEGLKAAFSEAVSTAVNERIRGSAPRLSAVSGKDAFLDGLCK